MSCGRGQPTQLVKFGSGADEPEKFLAKVQGLAEGEKPKTRQTVIDLTHVDDRCAQYDNSNLDKQLSTD